MWNRAIELYETGTLNWLGNLPRLFLQETIGHTDENICFKLLTKIILRDWRHNLYRVVANSPLFLVSAQSTKQLNIPLLRLISVTWMPCYFSNYIHLVLLFLFWDNFKCGSTTYSNTNIVGWRQLHRNGRVHFSVAHTAWRYQLVRHPLKAPTSHKYWFDGPTVSRWIKRQSKLESSEGYCSIYYFNW